MSYKSKKATPVKTDPMLASTVTPLSKLETENVIESESPVIETEKELEIDTDAIDAASTSALTKALSDVDNPLKEKPIKNIKAPSTDILEGFTLLITDGKALKLSPKTQNNVFYQLAVKDEDKSLHIRMSGNEGGGLHTKFWVSVDAIISLLDEQVGKSIKSTLIRPVFKGGSANNCGFIATVLRSTDIGLLTQSDKSVFVHRLHDDYQANKAKLLALVK